MQGQSPVKQFCNSVRIPLWNTAFFAWLYAILSVNGTPISLEYLSWLEELSTEICWK